MQNSTEMIIKPVMSDNEVKLGNGLQNLVTYYQGLFDRDENIYHYSPDDYQKAKRKFVKYLLKSRDK